MTRRLAAVVALALLPVLAAASAAVAGAQEPRVASVTMTPFVALVGERLTLTIVVEHDAGVTLAGPGAAEDFGGLELIAIGEPVTVRDGSGETTTLTYTLAAFAVGTNAVPPLEIAWRGPGVEGTVSTPAAPFAIDASVAAGDDSILPLKAQIAIPQPAPPAVVPATFVAVMALLTAAGYWLMRRAAAIRPPARAVVTVAVAPGAAAVARAELDALASEGAARGDPASFYARLSGTVRRYLGARYGFAAQAMTRTEIEEGMLAEGIDRWPARLTANLMEQSAAAEYARAEPAAERREQDLTAAYEIVDVTADDLVG